MDFVPHCSHAPFSGDADYKDSVMQISAASIPADTRDPKRRVLKDVFGFDDFRPGQDAVMEALLAGRNVLAVMPTGAGKSLCYQVPALVLGGLTLVVSPLVALMQDQVAGAAPRRRGRRHDQFLARPRCRMSRHGAASRPARRACSISRRSG